MIYNPDNFLVYKGEICRDEEEYAYRKARDEFLQALPEQNHYILCHIRLFTFCIFIALVAILVTLLLK